MRAVRQHLVVAVLVALSGCFSDPPPAGGGTSEGTAGESGVGSTSATSNATTDGTGAQSSTTLSTSDSASDEAGSTVATSVDGSSTAAQAVCGDMIVDDGEMCDGTPGCDGACEFLNYACNPLNNAGCAEPLRCGLVDFATETFACMEPGPAGVGEECGQASSNDGDCATDLTCLFNPQTVLCDVGNCCVRYCDLSEGVSGCDAFELCAQFFPNPMYMGLEHLGFCFSE